MNINDCTICNRGNVDCNYRLDCSNDIKKNNVQSPCPGFENKILDCDIDKPCPVYIKIDPPNPLVKRNIPDKVCPAIPDYRGEYKVCAKYISKTPDLKTDLTKKHGYIHHPKNDMTPGKGCGLDFLRNIDIDSELRRGKNHSECPENNYRGSYCKKTVVSNPRLLNYPSCENNKYYAFNDIMGGEKTKCNKKLPPISRDTSKKYRLNLKDKNVVKFNYEPTNSECYKNPLEPNNTLLDLRQPLLFQEDKEENKAFMQVGPERRNHTVENIWGNVTRRKYI